MAMQGSYWPKNPKKEYWSCLPISVWAFPYISTRAEEGQADRQSHPGQAVGGIQKQAQLPTHLLSPKAMGLVLWAGGGGKTSS